MSKQIESVVVMVGKDPVTFMEVAEKYAKDGWKVSCVIPDVPDAKPDRIWVNVLFQREIGVDITSGFSTYSCLRCGSGLNPENYYPCQRCGYSKNV